MEDQTILSRAQFVALLKEKTENMSLRAAAIIMGVPHQSIDKALKGEGPLGKQLPAALGYEAVTYYKPITKKKRSK